MQSKNYYKILGISSVATGAEIKAAYRKLAFKFHPDKHAGDKNAEKLILEINEAYSILSNKDKRKQYDLQHIELFSENTSASSPVSAEFIYLKIVEIGKLIAHEDPFRMNRDTLCEALNDLFSAYHIALLNKENNRALNNSIVDELLLVSCYLSFKQQKDILNLTSSISHDRTTQIAKCLKKQRSMWFWHKYQALVVLIITLTICIILFYILTLRSWGFIKGG